MTRTFFHLICFGLILHFSSCEKKEKKLTVEFVVGEYKFLTDYSQSPPVSKPNVKIYAAPNKCDQCIEIEGIWQDSSYPLIAAKVSKNEIIIPEQIVATKSYASGGMGGGLPSSPATFNKFTGIGVFNNLLLQFDFDFKPGLQIEKSINWIDTSVNCTYYLEKIK